MKRIVIGSLQQFLSMLEQKPELLDIPSFASLRPVLESIQKEKSGCCGVSRIHKKYRPTYESTLANIPISDLNQLKSLLNVERVCYYYRNGRQQLDMRCL